MLAEAAAAASPGPFPFLRLPIELRRLVYRHLIPNLAVPIWTQETPPPLFRDDGRPCCPAILRLNKTIYEEALEEWYGSVSYSAELRGDNMCFLGREIQLRDTPPSTLLAIRSLKVELGLLNPRRDDGGPIGQGDVREGVAALARHLSGPHRLQRLHLNLVIRPPWFTRRIGKPDDIRQGLAWNLSPLRAIHGLSELHAEIQIPPYLPRMLGYSERFFRGKAEHETILQEFMRVMECEMLDIP